MEPEQQQQQPSDAANSVNTSPPAISEHQQQRSDATDSVNASPPAISEKQQHRSDAADPVNTATPAASEQQQPPDAADPVNAAPPSVSKPRADPAIELGEAFEGFVAASARLVKKKKKRKRPTSSTDAKRIKDEIPGVVKIQLKNVPTKKSRPSSTRKGLAKAPIRPFGALVDDDSAFFSPPELSDDEDGGLQGLLEGQESYYTTGSYAKEFEDSLNFYAETHEEQDPVYAEFAATKAKERREAEMARLDAEEADERIKLDAMIAVRMQEHDRKVSAQMQTIRQQTAVKQQKQKDDLLSGYRRKVEGDKNKISEGFKFVAMKQRKDFDKASAMMQQRIQEKRLSREQASTEWQGIQQQLQVKHQTEQMHFKNKEDELRKRTEELFKYEGAQMREHHKKRLKEMEIGIEKLLARYKQQQDHTRNRYLRRYEERIKKRRDAVLKRFALIEPKALAESPTVAATPEKKETASSPTDEASTPTGHNSSTPPKKHASGENKSGGSHHPHQHHGRSSSSSEKFHSLFHASGSDAIQRQKRRKAVLSSQSVILQVEVHNEGVFVMPRILESEYKMKDGPGEPKDDPKKYNKFIPWGVKARSLLHSIVCGQVPDGFGWDDIPYAGSLQAGQVKCMVTDMRTSEGTATAQRAMAMKEYGIARTKANLTLLKTEAQEAKRVEAEANERSQLSSQETGGLKEKLAIASEEQQQARKLLSSFKEKASKYFNADGSLAPITSEANQQKLLAALGKYRGRVEESDQLVNSLQSKVQEATTVSEQFQKKAANAKKDAHAAERALKKAVKMAQIEHEKDPEGGSRVRPELKSVPEGEEERVAECRVERVLDVLWTTAEKRRGQLELKRRGNWGTDWKVGSPKWPDALKQALWGKMQRRRLQMVLRPTRPSALGDVNSVLKELVDGDGGDASDTATTEQRIRTEQLLLLSLHPVAESPRPSAKPPSSSSGPWAEPGWQVVLDVPKDKSTEGILPRSCCTDTLLCTFQADCSSVPGRQAAATIRQSHLRLLCNPLSAIAQASAPAEAHPSGYAARDIPESTLEFDPLRTTEEEMQQGYSFVDKPSTRKARPSSRKRSSGTKASPKEARSAGGPTKKRRTSKAKTSSPSTKGSTNSVNAGSSPMSRKKTIRTKKIAAKDQSIPNEASGEIQSTISLPQVSVPLQGQAPKSTSPQLPQQLPAPGQQPPPASPRHLPAQQPPDASMRNLTPNSSQPMTPFNPRSPAPAQNSTTPSPSQQKVIYQGFSPGAAQNVDGQVAIPQPPPPPQVTPHPYQQQQQQQQPQQQQAYYQQQQQQEAMRRFYAAQQAAAQMRSPMQMPYSPQQQLPPVMQRAQSGQGYPGQPAPLQMQARAATGPPGQMASVQQQLQGIPIPGNMQQRQTSSTTSTTPTTRVGPNNALLQLYGNNNQQQKK